MLLAKINHWENYSPGVLKTNIYKIIRLENYSGITGKLFAWTFTRVVFIFGALTREDCNEDEGSHLVSVLPLAK